MGYEGLWMNDELTFDDLEDRLIGAALKAKGFMRPLPPGMAGRLAERVHAAASQRSAMPRWLKIAGSLAAIASFAAFAATVALRMGEGTVQEGRDSSRSAAYAVNGSSSDETFEEIFSEELAELKQQEEERAMNKRAVKGLAAGALVAATAFTVPSAQGAVRGSVFDDVKVWYKGSAGNAVGTADSSTTTKIKNLPNLADSTSSMHGGDYGWWGWRVNYTNQKVDCPYAGVTLDSTPCMVIPSYAAKTGDATVTIDGKETTQPYWTARRFGDLHFTNWMSDWASGTVCSNWTCVLRFRSDQVNQVSGNANNVIGIGSQWDATAGKATGVALLLNTPVALADYACPRTFVTTTQENYTDIKIKSGRWVDCALAVNGQTLSMWFCWNDGTDEAPTNKLAKISKTYPMTKGLPTISAGCRVQLASTKDAYSATFTNGVYNADMANKAFEGAFHQIAFWDRTLSDDEIREAMAGGTSRPNLVQVGIEGNGINEFAATPSKTSVATDGDWENLNPTLTAANPSATVTFNCPALWGGKPQYLRVPMAAASTSGKLSVALNDEVLGVVSVKPGNVVLLYVPESKIVSGVNTLVLTRTDGESLVLDAVTMGGSWQFGASIASFSYQNAVTDNPDNYRFNPACGADEIHHRGLLSGKGNETQFDFYVPADLIGKYRGVFATKPQNTGGAEKDFAFYANGEKIGDYKLKGGVTTEVKVSQDALVAGWNRLSWMSASGGDWANIDWHKFTVLPPPKGLAIIIR